MLETDNSAFWISVNTLRFDWSGVENFASIDQGRKTSWEMSRKDTKTGKAEGWNHRGFLLLRLTESRVT